MKYTFLLLFFAISTTAFAQQSTLRGIVAVFNSQFETGKRQFVANAQVEEDYGKSQATVTAADGSFDLPLIGIKDQEKVFYSIRKKGFEVVNAEALQAIAGQAEQQRIFMAPEGKIAENKLKYYQINGKAAEKALTEKIKGLEKEIASAQSDQDRLKQLQAEYGRLQAQFENLDNMARDLADRYAKTNLDEVSADYQRAFRCFQRGQLDSALLIFNAAGLESDASRIISEQNRSKDLAAEYARRDSRKNERKQETNEALRFKANLHKSIYEFEKVENCYSLLLRLDSTDVNVLSEYASYLDLQNNKIKAIQFFEKALKYSKHEIDEADFCNSLGVLYSNIQRNGDAAEMYNRAFNIKKRLYETNRFPGFLDGMDQQNSKFAIVETNKINYGITLAATSSNLALLYNDLKQLEKAEEMYDYTLKIYAMLVNYIPEEIEPDIARFSINIGNKKYYNNQMPEAEGLYISAEQIFNRLATENPDLYLNEWMQSVINLANLYAATKNDKAEGLYIKALKVAEDLAATNSSRYSPILITILYNFGDYYRKNQQLQYADRLYERAVELYGRLEENEQNFDIQLAKASINIADFYGAAYYYNKAKGFYLMGMGIYQRLAETNPIFEGDFANSMLSLANIYASLNKHTESETAYLDALNILERLCLNGTGKFDLDLARGYMNLGILYKYLKRYDEAEQAYLRSLEIREALVKKDPVQFEPFLPKATMNLANFYAVMSKPDLAEKLYLRSLEVTERLMKSDSTQFEPELGRVLENLAIFYQQQQQPVKAEKLYLKSIDIRTRLTQNYPGKFEPELAGLLEVAGIFYGELGQLDKSKENLTLALSIRIKAIQDGQTQFYERLSEVLGSLENLRDDFELRKDYLNVADVQKHRAACYDTLREIDPSMAALAANEYSVLSFFNLFAHDFKGAEQAALTALRISPQEHSYKISLASALLLQNNYQKAKDIFIDIKDLATRKSGTYGQTCLEFLSMLEADGITHPDIPKIRKLLQQK